MEGDRDRARAARRRRSRVDAGRERARRRARRYRRRHDRSRHFRQGHDLAHGGPSRPAAITSPTTSLSALRTPIVEAEKIKKKYGCCLATMVSEEDTIEVPSVGGRKARILPRQLLSDILQPRAEEVCHLVYEEVQRAGYERVLNSGIVFTGGKRGARRAGGSRRSHLRHADPLWYTERCGWSGRRGRQPVLRDGGWSGALCAPNPRQQAHPERVLGSMVESSGSGFAER